MNPKASSIAVLLFILGIIFFTQYNPEQQVQPNYETVKIANWNMQIFGSSKANDAQLMNSYADKIKQYDIIFLQEIKDDSGIAANTLCSMLKEYNCKLSSRAGTTSSKEQYLLVYKKNIELKWLNDYNEAEYNQTANFERPPIKAYFFISYNKTANYINFTTENFTLGIWNIHIKPDNVKQELTNLQSIIAYQPNTIILGDLNADCSYYKPENETIFRGWNWIIKDDMDTTVGSTNCAYDRIITDNELYLRIVNSGIDTDVTKEQSDHYIIWVELNKDSSINR